MDSSISTRPRVARRPGAQAPEPAFVLIEPMHRIGPLLLASPHSGRRYPDSLLSRARASLLALRRAEDAYVDALFSDAPSLGAPLLCATLARAYVDLNRDPNDLDPAMYSGPLQRAANSRSARVQAGLGVIPRVAGDGSEIYKSLLAVSEATERLALVHAPYHAALQAQLVETRAQFGCAVLLDCHSMPSCARGPFAPDIVLGDRFGAAASPELIQRVEQILKRMGYRVARNAPFAGGYVTERYGRPEHGWHALQIEISRGLYLNEQTLEPSPGFEPLRRDMHRLIQVLLELRLERRLG